MFFKFFKRSPPPPPSKTKPKRRQAKPQDTTIPMLPPEPSSLEVTEGSEHTDWALWEDSVATLDSRLSELQPKVKIYRQESETPTEFQDVEAFARVRRKDP